MRKILTILYYVKRQLWIYMASVVFSLLMPHHFTVFKSFFLRLYVKRVRGVGIISPGFFCFKGGNLYVGDCFSFGYNFQCYDFERVTIGDRFLCSHNVTIVAGTHELNEERTYRPGPVVIGNNVWVGANVIIVGPCTIGDNVIIGANSFVKDDVPMNSNVAGSPAKRI